MYYLSNKLNTMKTEKNIISWYGCFVLAVLNLATLATVLFHANRSTNAVSVQPFSEDQPMRPRAISADSIFAVI
jgi:large-conductance mechanosensitive channel